MARILQVTNSYAPAYSFGGPVRLFEIYAEILRKHGFFVSVLTTDMLTRNTYIGPRVTKLSDQESIEYSRASRFPFLMSKNINLHFPLYRKVISAIHKYDYVQFCEMRGLLPLVLLLFCSRYKVKLIYHSFGMIKPNKRLHHKIYDSFFMSLFKTHVNLYFVENIDESNLLISMGLPAKKIKILPHPVYLKPRIIDCINKSKTSIRSEIIRLCYVGRIHRLKGVRQCISFVNEIERIFPESRIQLEIMGDDDDGMDEVITTLNALKIKGAVNFLPASYGDERFNLYCKSDFFIILPEENFQTSLASIEALCCGTPVINNDNSIIEGFEDFVCNISNKKPMEIGKKMRELMSLDRKFISENVRRIHSLDCIGSELSENIRSVF